MTQLSIVPAVCVSEDAVETLTRAERAELISKVDVLSRRLGPGRPSRWLGAAVEVLAAWPNVPFTAVAKMQAPGTSTFATAVVYEQLPEVLRSSGAPAAQPKGVQLLIKRARAFGADAIVLHRVGDRPGELEADFADEGPADTVVVRLAASGGR